MEHFKIKKALKKNIPGNDVSRSDAALVSACLLDDEHAWKELIDRYVNLMKYLAGKRDMTYCFDELFSDFLLKLRDYPDGRPGALRRYDGSSSLKTYLCAIFGHIIIDHLRAQSGKVFVDMDHVYQTHGVESNVKTVEKEEIYGILTSVINQLPEEEQQFLQWYYYDEETLKIIGKRLGISEPTASRYHRKILAKVKLMYDKTITYGEE